MSKVLCLLPQDHLQKHFYDTKVVIRNRKVDEEETIQCTKRKKTKCQTMVDITLFRKLRIELLNLYFIFLCSILWTVISFIVLMLSVMILFPVIRFTVFWWHPRDLYFFSHSNRDLHRQFSLHKHCIAGNQTRNIRQLRYI